MQLLGWWLALLALPAAAQPGPVVLRDTARDYPLGRQSAVLALPQVPGQAPLTLADVRGRYAGQFRASTQDVPTIVLARADVWLRCDVRADTGPATRWLLRGLLRGLDPFEAYLVDAAGRVRFRQRASSRPFAASHVVTAQNFNLRLPLPPGERLTLYLHGGSGEQCFVISEENNLREQARWKDLGAAVYFTTLLTMLLYNLLLYLLIRDRSYWYYVLFVASFGLLQAQMSGYLHLWMGPARVQAVEGPLGLTLLAATMVFSVLTARAFLETARAAPRLDRALRALAALTPALVLSGLVPQLAGFTYVLLIALPLLTVAGLLGACVGALRRGYRPANYYLAGWVLLMAAIVLYYLRTLGLLPLNFLTEYGVRVASALEVILLSMGLADRINLARRDKERAQAEALAVAREKEDVQRRANRDLTQAYDELQASLATTDHLTALDEVKTRFFTNISHELRTPLTLILSPLEQMLTEPAPRPEVRPMHRNARRLLHLITQLLDITRLEAGSMRLRAVPTDLARAVRATAEVFGPLALAHDVALTVTAEVPPPGTAPLYADADKLEQILSNLLSNALKFTPPGGQVRVRVGYADGLALASVTDTGTGIAAAQLLRVFERFEQADAGRQRQHGGSGVGLALVRELVALHGGTATASSTVGEGSTFTVSLALGTAHLTGHDIGPAPLPDEAPAPTKGWAAVVADELALAAEAEADFGAEFGEDFEGDFSANSETDLRVSSGADAALETGAVAAAAADSAARPRADERPLVLIVDDSADLRHYLRHCLQADYRLLLAADGTLGLARAQAALPDLIVSDLMMPGLDGLELCERLKTDERTSHIPVVLLTALGSEASRLAGLELGADDYLTKPFRPAELLARVRNLIAGRRQLRQRFGREMTLQPRDIALTSADERFLTRALAVVETHLADPDFSAERFADDMAVSRMQLHRKLKALTDQSATGFVRTLRLRRAAQLLGAGAMNVAEAADATGFGNLSHFARHFRELHGVLPSSFGAKK